MNDADFERALRENELLAAENERLLIELREKTEKYDAIRNSLSWRVTAPLRAALDWAIAARGDRAELSGPLPFTEDNYRRWVARFDTLTESDRSAIRARIARLHTRPLLSILIVVQDSPADALKRTLHSIRRQLYREWEICLVDDASTAPHVARALAGCGDDPRVRISRRNIYAGPAAARQDGVAMARGEFYAFLDPGDQLAESALFEIAAELNSHPDADLIYSDEDELDADGRRRNPRFKTAWNPDLLQSQDYIGKLSFRRANPTNGSTHHIPAVLCHGSSPPPTLTPAARATPQRHPTVTAIIPTRDRAELLERCVEGLLRRTNYPELDIIVVDNGSREHRTAQLFANYRQHPDIRILPFPGEFNWAAMNNAAARLAAAEVLLFLNNDIDVLEPAWLGELAAHAIRPEVGSVGAKLLFADGAVQHAGIWLGPGGRVRHLLRLSARTDPGYLGQLSLTRNLSAVTGACMAVRADVFRELGGFDETYPVSYNDLDFCLRLSQRGYRTVWTPHAELLHLESASRGSSEWRWRKEEADHKRFVEKWHREMDEDPFFNPNLDLIGEEKLALACPPRKPRAWRL